MYTTEDLKSTEELIPTEELNCDFVETCHMLPLPFFSLTLMAIWSRPGTENKPGTENNAVVLL